jgi:hypothetical protein
LEPSDQPPKWSGRNAYLQYNNYNKQRNRKKKIGCTHVGVFGREWKGHVVGEVGPSLLLRWKGWLGVCCIAGIHSPLWLTCTQMLQKTKKTKTKTLTKIKIKRKKRKERKKQK